MTMDDRMPGVVITGAAGDMGRALADSYLADGFRVFGGDVAPVTPREGLVAAELDVCDRMAVFALAEHAAATSDLRIWINAAGIVRATPVRNADPDDWDRIIAVNLTGTFYGCAAALEVMAEAGRGGRIVNVGSLSGHVGGTGVHPAYGASKAGVHALTKSYGLEGAKSGVCCNAVAPSVVLGSMADGFRPDQIERLERGVPLKRLARMEEDIVPTIRFLADERQAGYLNGVILPVNGGSYMPG